jgi:hypothetical protein
MKAFGVKDDVKLALEIEDIALAERRSDDSHFSSMGGVETA